MTREEAKEIVKRIKGYMNGGECWSESEFMAMDMAIKALSQEPCYDVVSRQAVLAFAHDTCLDLNRYDDTEEFCDEIKELPSVTPKSETECLKAQAEKQAMPMSCDDCCYEPNSPFCEMYRKDICEKKEERQTGKWIHVSERLPNKNQWVLVTTEDYQKPIEIMCYQGIRTSLHKIGNSGWEQYDYPSWTSGHGDIQSHHPKAWQPLPKPYEPQESKG